nr:MAG TPA: hypothetical protein [Caudoviricetes sp.]
MTDVITLANPLFPILTFLFGGKENKPLSIHASGRSVNK